MNTSTIIGKSIRYHIRRFNITTHFRIREKEELTSAIATAYNVETGKVDKTKLKDALGTGWSLAEGDTAPYTVTSPKGNKFTVAAAQV